MMASGQSHLGTAEKDAASRRGWLVALCTVESDQADPVGLACFDLGSCGLQTEDLGDHVRLSAYFPATRSPRQLRRALTELFAPILGPHFQLSVNKIPDQDWSRAWRDYFRPVWATPRIVVHPPWLPVDVEPSQIAIAIDPGMAFGTGGHESTRLCLQALEDVIRPGNSCLDVGTGSGVLALAALRLGASRVVAVDVDPVAVENARENLRINGLAEAVVAFHVGRLNEMPAETFDVIMANIQRTILSPMLSDLKRRTAPHGRVILSGILVRERREFGSQVHGAGLRVGRMLTEGEWLCMTAEQTADHA